MDLVQQLLLLSEKLFNTLEKLEDDKDGLRDKQIELIDRLLDARGQTIDQLLKTSDKPLKGHPDEKKLEQLDKGIIERLEICKSSIALDMQQLQVSMKSEERYVNPYRSLHNLDGTYFDGRK